MGVGTQVGDRLQQGLCLMWNTGGDGPLPFWASELPCGLQSALATPPVSSLLLSLEEFRGSLGVLPCHAEEAWAGGGSG